MATDRASGRAGRPVRGGFRAPLFALLTLVALQGGVARAQYVPPGYVTPEFSGVAGTKISGIGLLADGSCTNVRNVVIRFGDGTSGPPDTSAVEGAGTRISGSHTYAAAGDYLGAVDLDATCTNNLGVPSDQHATGNPGGYPLGFIVHVAQAAAGPLVCSTAAARVAAQAAQTCASPPPKKRFDALQKKALAAVSRFSATRAAILAGALKYDVVKPDEQGTFALMVQAVAAGSAATYSLSAFAAGDLFKDPPDPSYATAVKQRTLPVRRVRRQGAFTAEDAARVNRFQQASATSASLHEALLSCIERAQGATIDGQTGFEKAQMLAAARFAGMLEPVLRELPAQTKAAVNSLIAGGVTMKISRTTAAHVKAEVAKKGLPTSIRQKLAVFGARQQSAGDLLTARIASAPASALVSRFPQSLGSVELLRAYAAEAAAIHSFAKQVKADPLAAAS